jgi:hypothetical protein
MDGVEGLAEVAGGREVGSGDDVLVGLDLKWCGNGARSLRIS